MNAIGEKSSELTQHRSAKRMPNEISAHYAEGIEDGAHVRYQGGQIVVGRWVTRRTVTATGNAIYVELVREPRGKIVEGMGGIAKPVQENDRIARSAPIKHF